MFLDATNECPSKRHLLQRAPPEPQQKTSRNQLGARHDLIRDAHGRTMRKLRVQLTDACNLRCFYCMPDNPRFLSASALMSPSELESVVRALVPFGLSEIRLTGGEPTSRREFLEICKRLSPLASERLGMTTNGLFPTRLLDSLWEHTRLRHLNFSLDSLQESRFKTITRYGDVNKVIHNIRVARDRGFTVKINCILFRDINVDEVMDFVSFSEKEQIEVRFLEYMAVGPRHEDFRRHFISARAIQEDIRGRRTLTPLPSEPDATAYRFATHSLTTGAECAERPNQGAQPGRIGFIASESEPFCSSCSRLRLSATGVLRSCLFREEGLSVRHVSAADLEKTIRAVVSMKPVGRPARIVQPMNQIGG